MPKPNIYGVHGRRLLSLGVDAAIGLRYEQAHSRRQSGRLRARRMTAEKEVGALDRERRGLSNGVCDKIRSLGLSRGTSPAFPILHRWIVSQNNRKARLLSFPFNRFFSFYTRGIALIACDYPLGD